MPKVPKNKISGIKSKIKLDQGISKADRRKINDLLMLQADARMSGNKKVEEEARLMLQKAWQVHRRQGDDFTREPDVGESSLQSGEQRQRLRRMKGKKDPQRRS